MKSQEFFTVNQKDIGAYVPEHEAHIFVEILTKMGYNCQYSAERNLAPKPLAKGDWSKAQYKLSAAIRNDNEFAKSVPQGAPVRNYSELSLVDRLEFLGNVCNYLTTKLEQVPA